MCRRIALVAAVVLGAGCARIIVSPVTANMGGDGVLYALPNTVARVLVRVEMTKFTDAPYSRLTEIFVPGGRRACKEGCSIHGTNTVTSRTVYAPQQGATFTTFGEPDPANIYVVRFTGKGQLDQSLSMAWTETGLLSTASATVTNRSTDIAVSGIKLLGSVGSKLFAGPVRDLTDANKCPAPFAKSTTTDSSALAHLKRVPEGARNVLIENYCSIAPGERATIVGTDGLLHRAVIAYNTNVVPLLTARVAALTNRSAIDVVAVLSRVDGMISEQLASLFLGTTTPSTWEGSFDIRDIVAGSPVKLFDFDAKAGLCVVESLLAPGVKAYPEGFEARACATPSPALPVNVTFTLYPEKARQLFASVETARLSKDGHRGFRYRVPAQVRAILDYTPKTGDGTSVRRVTLGDAVFAVAQLGTVVSLPAMRNSKTLSYELGMVESTGGLKSFKLGTTGVFDAGTIDALSGVGGGLLDARKAATDAQAAKDKQARTDVDELTLLTRQQALLKLKDEICELQKKAGTQCTVTP